MAMFLAMYAWEGEFTDAYFAQPDRNPAQFGLPGEDDGSTAAALPRRGGVPQHHAGVLDGESGWSGRPAAFAARLREVLSHHTPRSTGLIAAGAPHHQY
jgi:hypothetical protein